MRSRCLLASSPRHRRCGGSDVAPRMDEKPFLLERLCVRVDKCMIAWEDDAAEAAESIPENLVNLDQADLALKLKLQPG